ncbi:MAG: hypothetical protein WBB31_10975 [Saprospiraceae bacterium]
MAPKNSFYPLLIFVLISSVVIGQSYSDIINRLDRQLKRGETSISKVLSNDSLMYLHSLTSFREIIKENAKPEKIIIASSHEPGTKITVKGHVVDKKGKAYKNILLYFYQTSDSGWYADTAAHILEKEGDMKHARLFGYLKTDEKGEFSFETIKPNGYPKSSITGHIHIQCMVSDSKSLTGPTELHFEDDRRMNKLRKKEILEEGNLTAKNTGTAKKPVYEYKIVAE